MKKRNRILIIILSVILFLSLAGAACFGVWHVLVEKRMEGCRSLERFMKQEEMELTVEVSADFGGTPFSAEASLFRKTAEGGSFFGITLDTQALYLNGDTFYLPNGRTFRLSVQLPQGDALLEQAKLVLSASKVTREQKGDETVYRAEAGIDQAKTILKYLSPQTAEKMSVIDSLTVTLTAREDTLQSLTVAAAGSDGENPYSLTLTLTSLPAGTLDTGIPQAVLDAAANPEDIITLRWDPDLLPLLRGALALVSQDDFQAAVNVTLDCGILSFSKELDLRYSTAAGIGRAAGEKLEIYFSGSRLCTAGGRLLTEYDELPLDRLPALVLPVLVEGRVTSLRSGDTGLYTMPLTQEELDMIAAMAASQAAGLTISLTEGTLEARVEDNRLTSVCFSCSGSVPFLKTEIPAGVSLELLPSEDPQSFVLPDPVREALGAGTDR